MFSVPSQPDKNLGKVYENSRAGENPRLYTSRVFTDLLSTASRVFTDLLSTASWVFTDLLSNSPKRSPRFLPGYEGTEKFFHFLNKERY